MFIRRKDSDDNVNLDLVVGITKDLLSIEEYYIKFRITPLTICEWSFKTEIERDIEFERIMGEATNNG